MRVSAAARRHTITGLSGEPYEVKVRAILTGGRLGGYVTGTGTPLLQEETKQEEEEKEKEPPTEEPPGEEEEPMLFGLNAGGWGPDQYADVGNLVNTVRLAETVEKGCATPEWEAHGIKTICDLSIGYNGGGVNALNADAVAADALRTVKANPKMLAIEILNEPGNPAFWGPEAASQENARAYTRILKAVHEVLVNEIGPAAPPILASYDGGNGYRDWYSKMVAADPNVGSYIDGITIHAYSGASAIGGDRELIEEAHATTGKQVWVTEFGWTTCEVSEAEQAENIKHFVEWARTKSYIAAMIEYGWREPQPECGWAPEIWHDGVTTHRLSYAVIKELSGK